MINLPLSKQFEITSVIARLGAALVLVCSLSCVPPSHAQTPASSTQVRKLLILGNSITLHGPAEKIGWSGNWGMAASAKEKDFVHLVAAGIGESSGTAPELMVRNIADFERQYATYEVAAKLKDQIGFEADLIVIAIGENVPALKSEEDKAQFEKSVTKLLQSLKTSNRTTILVRSCFWANVAKDQALKKACQAVGGVYVDIGQLSKDEANFARSEREFKHKGVANHPGDKGMQAIADAILKAVNNR